MPSNTIHRIWMGGEMPTNFRQFGEEWIDLNPEFNIHDWTEEEIFDTKWINQDVIDVMVRESRQPGADSVAFYTHVADVVGYELAYSGGWYFNCDLKPIKPLATLGNPDDIAAIAFEDDWHLVNMAMYGAGEDDFYRQVIETLPKRYFGMPRAYMHETTGAQLLKQVYGEYTGELVTFPRTVFNPIHFSEVPLGQELNINEVELPPETVALHLWGHRTNARGHRVIP